MRKRASAASEADGFPANRSASSRRAVLQSPTSWCYCADANCGLVRGDEDVPCARTVGWKVSCSVGVLVGRIVGVREGVADAVAVWVSRAVG